MLFIAGLISIAVSYWLNKFDKGKHGKNVLNAVILYKEEEHLSSGYCSTESELDVDNLLHNRELFDDHYQR